MDADISKNYFQEVGSLVNAWKDWYSLKKRGPIPLPLKRDTVAFYKSLLQTTSEQKAMNIIMQASDRRRSEIEAWVNASNKRRKAVKKAADLITPNRDMITMTIGPATVLGSPELILSLLRGLVK